MPLTLKEEVLKMVESLDDDGLAIVKAEIEYINNAEPDVIDQLSERDRAELLQLINDPDEKDTVSHEEYLKATSRWRIS